MTKLKIGVYGIAGCSGCLLSVLFETNFLKIAQLIDLKAFPLIKEDKYKGDFDLVFIEGTVTFKDDIKTIKELRKRAKKIVALGTCSSLGGVPTIRNFMDEKKVMKFVYPKVNYLKSVKPMPIDKYIKVDYYLPQCPPSKEEFLEFLKNIVKDIEPKEYNKPVCLECMKNENECLLHNGIPCLGPITNGGCDALCPSNRFECYGCRGPYKDANLKAFIKLLEEKGYNKKAIKDRITVFSGLKFEELNEMISKWLEK